MTPANGKILVSCDLAQKEAVRIGSTVFSTANPFEHNYRYKSPTICTVVEGNEVVFKGDVLLVHHNLLYLPSPHHVEADLFSVPFSKVLFCKVLLDGSLLPICGNILGERVEKRYEFEMPPEQRERYTDRIKVTHAGYTRYREGQILLTRPSAPYDIEYHIDGVAYSQTKVHEDMVTGYLK